MVAIPALLPEPRSLEERFVRNVIGAYYQLFTGEEFYEPVANGYEYEEFFRQLIPSLSATFPELCDPQGVRSIEELVGLRKKGGEGKLYDFTIRRLEGVLYNYLWNRVKLFEPVVLLNLYGSPSPNGVYLVKNQNATAGADEAVERFLDTKQPLPESRVFWAMLEGQVSYQV